MSATEHRMTGATVYVVRHGQTPWTVTERVQGWAPVPLNDTGVAQVEATAAYLQSETEEAPVRVIASDLRRVRESAEIVSEGLGLEERPDLNDAWRERDFGIFQGLSDERYHNDEVVQSSKGEGLLWTPENGESWRTLETRVLTAWERLRESIGGGETVVLVTHAGPIHCLMAALTGQRLETEFVNHDIAEASVAHVKLTDDGAEVTARNVTPYE